uniref:Reverse transcriptase zinc-binding domain-containing protein n=1 Tax=Aegilops tauschii subsp. strangulata TaxID=200361 RepID=A0A452XBT8_AEGTS
MDHDLDKARNLKLLLCAFEELSGLKINFHKSELFYFGDAAESAPEYAEIFGCQLGQFPIRYLGIPIHYRRLTIADWRHVEERLEKRLASWKAKLLSYGGRLILINSVLSNMVLYMLSFFHLSKGVLQRLDYFRSSFFWQSGNETKKYRLARSSVLCRPKSQGGLGIQDLEIKNIALLSKWVYKLLTENGVWQEIIRNKYVGSNAISQIHWKPGDSHFWSGVMKAKEFFFQFGTFSVRDGSQVRFWEDTWLGNNSLMVQYPSLYRIVRHKFVTIKQVFGQENPDISFHRDLLGTRLAAWNELLTRLEDIQLSYEPDTFRWNLHQNGKFSVKSMYDAMVHCDVPVDNRKLWKLKIPLRVKIFLWFLNKGVILTRDNLARRNWHGSKT